MILAELWPFIFMAILFFILSRVAKKSYDAKWNDAIKAKVINVKEYGNMEGQYTTRIKYDIVLEFKYDGKLRQKTITNQYVQWPVNSIVDINVYGDFVKILTPIPKNSYYKQFPPGYKILHGIMWFFIGYTVLGLMTSNAITEQFIIPTMLILLSWLLFTIRKKHLMRMDFIYHSDNLIYINATVTKILQNSSNNHRSYYAILEYEHNGILHTYDKEVRPIEHNIGDIIPLKCDKFSGEVVKMDDRKDAFINVGCLIGSIICLLTSLILIVIAFSNILF